MFGLGKDCDMVNVIVECVLFVCNLCGEILLDEVIELFVCVEVVICNDFGLMYVMVVLGCF